LCSLQHNTIINQPAAVHPEKHTISSFNFSIHFFTTKAFLHPVIIIVGIFIVFIRLS